MQQFLSSISRYSFPSFLVFDDNRTPVMVNLDPANECMIYECDVNIVNFVTVNKIMEKEKVGPNEALLRCIEWLENNFDRLLAQLEAFDENRYFIFDLPGQVELFTCHESLRNIIRRLERRQFRMAVVHLTDVHHCIDPMRYVSMLLITLKSMMHLECAQVNVLSKTDLLGSLDDLSMPLEFYLDVQDPKYLFAALEQDQFGKKYARLNEEICELIEESGLLSFVPLAVEDKDCMAFLLGEIDKANGYIFGALTAGNESITEAAVTALHRERLVELIKERYTRSTYSNTREK